MLQDKRAGDAKRPQPRNTVRQIAKTLAEKDSRPDRVGRVGVNALGPGVTDAPCEIRRDQCLVGIVAIDLPFDSKAGDVEPRAIGHTPVSRDPAAVDEDSDRWREQTRKGPV